MKCAIFLYQERSTWDVIKSSSDFVNGNNPPTPISDLVPEFEIIGSDLGSMNYVLCIDVSSAMLPLPENGKSKVNTKLNQN